MTVRSSRSSASSSSWLSITPTLLCYIIFLLFIASHRHAIDSGGVLGATFYTHDDGDGGGGESRRYSLSGQQLSRFRRQMFDTMGVSAVDDAFERKDSDAIADAFATRYMSALYSAISATDENGDDDDFLLSPTNALPMFEFASIRADARAANAIVSFVPRNVTRFWHDSRLYKLSFAFDFSNEFFALRPIAAQLHCTFDGVIAPPIERAEVAVGRRPPPVNKFRQSFDYQMSRVKFGKFGDITFFSLDVFRILDFESANSRLWIRFDNVDDNDFFADLTELHCFGVAFFIEAEPRDNRRVRRSHYAFEVEENLDEDEDEPEKLVQARRNTRRRAADEFRHGRRRAHKNAHAFGFSANEKGYGVDSGSSASPLDKTTITNARDDDGLVVEEVAEEPEEEDALFDDYGAASWGLVSDVENTLASVSPFTPSSTKQSEASTRPEFQSESQQLNTTTRNYIANKSSEIDETMTLRPNFPSLFRNSSRNKRCRVRSLYVDFKDLGWDRWVIAPAGYQADYCDGDCAFPLDNSVSPTNHAIIQTLMHLIDDKRAVSAKCAPLAMRAQSLLFFNSQKNVVLRRYSNMRVRQCGCR